MLFHHTEAQQILQGHIIFVLAAFFINSMLIGEKKSPKWLGGGTDGDFFIVMQL